MIYTCTATAISSKLKHQTPKAYIRIAALERLNALHSVFEIEEHVAVNANSYLYFTVANKKRQRYVSSVIIA